MTNNWIKHVIGLAAAAAATLTLFSAVVSIAKEDKMALAAARAVPAQVAAGTIESKNH